MIIKYDPLNMFMNVSDSDLGNLCSVIYHWAGIALIANMPMREVIHRHYGYALDPMEGGSVTENGLYSYPSDPDLYPLCKIEMSQEIIFFYEYEIIAIRNKDDKKTVVLRVD